MAPIWDSEEAWQQGLIDGDMIFLDKKKQEFTLGFYCVVWNSWELPGRTVLTFLALSNEIKGIPTAIGPSQFIKGLGKHLGGVSGSLGRTLVS
jgi:hypothetical protein